MSMPLECIVAAGFDDTTGYLAMQTLLQVKPVPDGIFCYNDPVAIGAMKAILEAGLNVPRDIAIFCAGNGHYSGLFAGAPRAGGPRTSPIGQQAPGPLMEQ